MRLDDFGNDVNVEDQGRGSGGGFGLPLGGIGLGSGGLGCGGIVLLIVVALLFGINPLSLLGGGGGPGVQQSAPVSTDANTVCRKDADTLLSCNVLASLNRTWPRLIDNYRPPELSFFSQNGQSGCGAAQSAMGPFYCPTDSKVYLDTDFYRELKDRFGAAGDFAQGYVIAHEVGHHIQNLLGTSDQVQSQMQQSSKAQGNALSVKLELQADCYAGVWAANAKNKDGSAVLEPGDVEEGLRAAQAIGDDTLQKAGQGVVVPESFTHGTSAQRQYWLKRGLESGNPNQCDTFAAGAPA
ncbi:MAG TPA: neutral zinc metallopeptidase [Sphingomonas sp.]|jgi:predicted metalloprotease|nr:neutral zinc metallopeptidase [Sphingomonas sp.]